ncbi:MAG: type II 3-dehydroquinate dehydratase [Eubacterium sp.]|nr:type II 3-dehydroquinate dehydratase [Eubacterium sp.]
MKILVINGPNLNLLGEREPGIYGNNSLENINAGLKKLAEDNGAQIEFYQSNHEGAIIDKLHDSRTDTDCVIINAGAYTHYSYAIRDAISAIKIPVIEVHLSNIHAREKFRENSVISAVCKGTIAGFGEYSYTLALQYALTLKK